MLTDIHRLNVQTVFISFSFATLPKLSVGHVRSPQALDHRHGQMGCGTQRG